MKGRPSKRDLILDAASHVVEQHGAGHLTIDAVADAAQVSKGGVLYHFPNKQALLTGMLDRMLSDFRTSMATTDSGRGQVHAHTMAFSNPPSRSDRSAGLALLAASAENPELLTNARAFINEMIEEARGSTSFADALIQIIAVEGQRVLHALGLLTLSSAEQKQLTERLRERAEGLSE